MKVNKIDEKSKVIYVDIPLSQITGKIRVKKRSLINEYGIPIFQRDIIDQSCYIEWQISYDLEETKNVNNKTTLKNVKYKNSKNEEKLLYELSEYIFYFYKWKIVKKETLNNIISFLKEINDKELLSNRDELQVLRSSFKEEKIFNINFLKCFVKYPLLIYKFKKFEIITEIKITEKQRAVGLQPMLYICFPIMELVSSENLIGRNIKSKEIAQFIIDDKNINVFIEMLKIFGVLTERHKFDVINIINTILELD